MKRTQYITALLVGLCSLSACSSGGGVEDIEYNQNPFTTNVTFRTLDKEEYYNKTLAGILGQLAGFFSGYEFVGKHSFKQYYNGGLPLSWFDFINGPYAGNVPNPAGFVPPGWDFNTKKDMRLRVNSEGIPEVWSDDDYHIDFFNQTILDEFGFTSYAIKEAWKKYQVADWGGGHDAMKLMNGFNMLAPFTGTIEAENQYSWCTEAYIENETLGFNAPGMPLLAEALVDKFGSLTGYQDSLIWGKFYAALYSMAYFESDVLTLLQEAKKVFPKGSFPEQFYNMAFDMFELYPNDHATAAQTIAMQAKNIYLMDDRMTNCNVNGAFAVLAWLYGKGEYIETCKYASCMGFDGDCTAAICTALMGIIHGLKTTNPEYNKINEKLYADGNGLYVNNQLFNYPARIRSLDYPEKQKITEIAKLYQKNFEKLLLLNGGAIFDNTYKIPCNTLYEDRSFLFDNYDAEKTDEDWNPLTIGFNVSGGVLDNSYTTDNEIAQSGDGTFFLSNTNKASVWHTYHNLKVGHHYRLKTYITNGEGSQTVIFARGGGKETFVTSATEEELIDKQLIFMATASSMDVGIRFDHTPIDPDECVIFDHFQLEEIEQIHYSNYIDTDMRLYSDKFSKVMYKPDNVKIGEEVILSIEYDNITGAKAYTKLLRNGKNYGGVVLSMTSLKNGSGRGVVEVPYIFETNQDILTFSFTDYDIKFGTSRIQKSSSYMIR